MAHKKTDDDHSEAVMNQLADSVLGLSDEVIVVETEEGGANADEEAERTRLVLRSTSQLWELQGQCAERLEDMSSRRTVSSLKR